MEEEDGEDEDEVEREDLGGSGVQFRYVHGMRGRKFAIGGGWKFVKYGCLGCLASWTFVKYVATCPGAWVPGWVRGCRGARCPSVGALGCPIAL